MNQSTYDVLKIRAESYFKTSEVALNSNDVELLQNSLENMHFALELSMKAAITKNGGTYADYGRQGHNLEGLMLQKFGDGISSILIVAKLMGQQSLFSISLSSWSMDCRYLHMKDYPDMRDAINDYKELYQWIKSNLLK